MELAWSHAGIIQTRMYANVYALKEESRPEKNNSALSSEPIDHGILTSAFQ